MHTSEQGLNFILSFETLKLKAYKALPTEKHYTIGCGHYGADVKPDMVITEAQAKELFRKDLQDTEHDVERCISSLQNCYKEFTPILDELKQNEFDALVSLVFNIGAGNFRHSTLLKKLVQHDRQGASEQFLVWRKSGGKVIQGLINRRIAEKRIFDIGVYQR